MNAPGPLTQTSTSEDRAFDALVFRVSADIEAGHSVDLTALAAEHPQHIGRLRKLLPTLQAMADLGHSGPRPRDQGPAPRKTSTPPHGALGDFRILREVGRGGMGVVYEAEQLSLHRRVALKVLPFAAVLDPRHLQRFKNEALAAAALEHQHIVDVYGVGCERGVHHYAMRFIDGQTLADVIAQLRERREAPTGRPSRQAPADPFAQTAVAYAVSTSTQAPRKVSFVSFPADGTAISREFFRSVALLGRDVANALDYAHERGVVHRDIKPGNIMLDGAGKAWVTDFGLAHIESDVSLTMSGDVLGTLRYMSPEQALGKRGAIDHRTDVYSLAITLYELLTLQPAYPQTDRQQLLQRIATEDPTPPRQLRPQIPADLETIVLKATAKNPQERYETAGDLADDLQRFLDYQPIKARRPTLSQRMSKWALRHTGLIWSAAAILLVSTVALGVSTLLIAREQSQTATALTQARDNFTEAQRQKTEAERHALKARRTAYVADMRLAFQQWNRDYLAEVQSLLDDQIPQPGEADLRGLEWYALRTQIGRRFHTLGRHDAPVHDIDLFPDGHTFATAGEDGYVRVWDADSRSLLREFHLQDKPVYTVGVSPDGKWLAYGAGRRDELDVPKPATIIDAQTGTVLGTTNWHKNTIRQVRFSPDGRYLASGSLQDKVSVWEFTDGVHGRSRDLTGEQDIPSEYFTLLFLDSRRLLTEYHNRTGYRVWDLETGEPLQDYPDLNEVNVHAVAWHPRHHVFAYVPSKDYGQTIQFRDGTTGRELGEYSLNEEVTALTFSPYTDSLSAGTARGCLRIMDLAFPPRSPGSDEPVQVKSTKLWQIHEGEIKRVRYLDRYRVITAGVDGRVVMRFASPSACDPSPFVQSKGTQLAAAPREGVIAWAGVDGAVRLADHQTGELLATTHPLPGGPQALAWSADGSHLAAICASGEFCCWRVEGTTLVECLRDSVTDMQDGGAGLALSRDGSRLYISGDRGPDGIHVWDVTTGLKAGFVPTLYTVTRLLVSPDDRLLIGAHEGLFVFDRETLEQRHYLQIGGVARALLFAPDGRTLIAGYGDGAIRLWDPEEGRLLRELVEYDRDDAVTSALLLSPDGQTLIAGDHKGRLRFWNTATWGCLGSLTVRSTRAITHGTAWIHSLAVTPAGDGLDLTTGDVDIIPRYFERLLLQKDK